MFKTIRQGVHATSTTIMRGWLIKSGGDIEQLTIALFDGNTASSPGYNDYLNGYVYIFYGWGNTKHRLTRGAGSSNVWLCDMVTASPAQLNNYYELEARWLDADKTDGDNLFGLVDGEIPAGLEARDGEYTSRTYLGFASWSNAEWRVDRVYVRKCASVEPVTEMGREFNKPAISTPMPTPQTTTFEYDDYNKLTEITFPDSATETLSYDDNGQLVRREKSTGETTTYEWNDAGFLTKVVLPTGEPVKYFYDGDNRLVGRESSEGYNVFIQSGWDIVEETDETGRRKYYTGLSAVKEESNDGTEYFHYNHRGDTVLKTDRDGNVLLDLSYEAYGKPTDETGIPVNEISLGEFPFLYNAEFGIRYDRKTKLHYMRNRWYSGEQMRFISSDLLMDLNRYAYVSGNPIIYSDIFGLQEDVKNIKGDIFYEAFENRGISPPKYVEIPNNWHFEGYYEFEGIKFNIVKKGRWTHPPNTVMAQINENRVDVRHDYDPIPRPNDSELERSDKLHGLLEESEHAKYFRMRRLQIGLIDSLNSPPPPFCLTDLETRMVTGFEYIRETVYAGVIYGPKNAYKMNKLEMEAKLNAWERMGFRRDVSKQVHFDAQAPWDSHINKITEKIGNHIVETIKNILKPLRKR